MEIKFYGHASIHIKTPQISIVTDPWFSKSGAFLNSWFQFPDNTELDLTSIRNADYVILSHEHQDHFDLNFLKTINPKTKIIIPKYTDSYLLDTLSGNLDNEIIVANSLKKIKLNNEITFCPVVQSVPIWDDCTLVFETPVGTIVDVNDMKIINQDLEWIKSNFKINYLLMQFSGANWHPYVYDFTHEKKAEIAQHRIVNKFHYVKNTFLESGADYLVPMAGPPCFLDDKHFELNFSDESIFPNQSDFYEFAKKEGFAHKIFILLPGDAFDPNQECKIINEKNLKHDAFVNRRKYLSDYKERRREIISTYLSKIEEPETSLLEKCKEYFEPLMTSSYFREKINGKVLLTISGKLNEKIILDFSDQKIPVKSFHDDDFFYELKIDSKFLNMILEKKLTWEQLLLSLRFNASRKPDVYNEYLIIFLRFANLESYDAYELYEKRKNVFETFILEYEGMKYNVQKYCPHAMGDLSKGKIINDCLVCPNHGWAFSLRDGSCLYNKSSIAIKKIDMV